MRVPAVALRYDQAPGSSQHNKESAPPGRLDFSQEQKRVVTGIGLLPRRTTLEVRIDTRVKLLLTPAASARADGNLCCGPRDEHRRRHRRSFLRGIVPQPYQVWHGHPPGAPVATQMDELGKRRTWEEGGRRKEEFSRGGPRRCHCRPDGSHQVPSVATVAYRCGGQMLGRERSSWGRQQQASGRSPSRMSSTTESHASTVALGRGAGELRQRRGRYTQQRRGTGRLL